MQQSRATLSGPVQALLAGLGFGLLAGFAVERFGPGAIHGPRVVALFACGGFLAGLTAWLFAQRLGAAAQARHAVPIWVGLAAVPGVIVAAITAGGLVDLLEDLESPAASAIVVTVHWLSCAAVSVGALAVIGLVAGALQASRCNVRIGPALLPILRPVIGGLVLLVAFAAGATHFRPLLTARLLELASVLGAEREAPERGAVVTGVPVYPARPSTWIEGEKRLFSAVLRGSGCDVLIVPFESRGDSVDRPGRSLMTRAIAAEIAARTGLCVTDPTLAARALGTRARTHEWSRLAAVATAIGARWLVRGEVTLDPRPYAFTLRLHVHDRAGREAPWSEPRSVSAGGITFSDDLPPEAAFAPRVASLVAGLGLPPRATPTADAEKPAQRALPARLAELAEDPGAALDRAERLQLLALAYPAWDVNAEQLWERSLVALTRSPDGESARVLRARANLHLFRRPYAVRLLHGLGSSEARVLAALADGNLPEAQEWNAAVQTPVAALIGALELERLRELYGPGATTGFEARREALLERHEAYSALLLAPLSSGDWFHGGVHELVQRELESLGVDVARAAAGSLARIFIDALLGRNVEGWLVWTPVVTESAYAPLWEARAEEWRAAQAFDRVAPWDVYDALFAANRGAVVRAIFATRAMQGRPKAALEVAKQLEPAFRDHPQVQAEIVLAMRRVAEEERDATQSARVLRRAREVYVWEGGETHASGAVDELIDSSRFYADEPPRPWRPLPWDTGDRFAATRLDAKRAETYAAHYLRALQYTQHELWYLERADEFLRQLGRREEAERLVRLNEQRFVGHFQRAKFLASRAAGSGGPVAELARLEEAIRVQPQEWAGYFELARAQLRGRQPQAAHRTLLGFPGFERDSQHPVALSNVARDGGTLLLRAGEPELARALLERSLAYRTGSAAEMWSGLRLAMIEHDYGRAREWGEQLHHRYRDEWGLTDVAILSFLMGDAQTGWRRFEQASQQFPGSVAWEAAFAGHRIAGTDRDGLIAFASQWQLRSGAPHVAALLRENFLFGMTLIDRAADEHALAAIGPFLGQGGDRAYALLVPGYHAFKRGEYAAAAASLRALNDALMNVSVNQKRALAYPLPYMTLALARSGQAGEAEALVRSFRDRVGSDFYFLLAQAYVDGLAGRAGEARARLWEAFLLQPDLNDLPIAPPYQLLEACERLFELTGDDAYRKLLVDLAGRTQHRWPWSWAFTFEAKHGTEPAARRRALALGLYLDRRSDRLASVGEAERRAAEAWLEQNNPFRVARR